MGLNKGHRLDSLKYPQNVMSMCPRHTVALNFGQKKHPVNCWDSPSPRVNPILRKGLSTTIFFTAMFKKSWQTKAER
jgi:hypothetical protein